MTNQNIDCAGTRGFPRSRGTVVIALADDCSKETRGLRPNSRG